MLAPSVAVIAYAAPVDPLAGQNRWFLLLILLLALLGLVATGAITYGVFQQLRGQRASLRDCLRVGLARLFPVLGVALLVRLAISRAAFRTPGR